MINENITLNYQDWYAIKINNKIVKAQCIFAGKNEVTFEDVQGNVYEITDNSLVVDIATPPNALEMAAGNLLGINRLINKTVGYPITYIIMLVAATLVLTFLYM
ncbi:hypothetical protein [Vibrio sp. D431a]|uniref:hypothetical protein n=1 Tax=Vibrio sp. D431a TaxID=2837388 RepID=UPI002553C090|nr:hypothetical protein [Vibrio sp. D431a]MDK9793300.1 hypothetical protein [Vibrio sp. D431a]